jgi:hypothetical protein
MSNILEEVEVREHESIVVLIQAEAVLMKRIKAMRDGKPKYAASERLNELRAALKICKDTFGQS